MTRGDPDEGSRYDPVPTFKSVRSFCAEYVPLAYIVEPILRTGSLYTVTAKTGAGKTGLSGIVALAVATGRREILDMDVEHGRVAYLAFENPDDVRMRLMAAAYQLGVDLKSIADRFVVLDERSSPESVRSALAGLAARGGPFSLIIIDTFAAAFDGRDINDNVQAGEFVRRLRPLSLLPGRPTVLIAAHPTKSAAEDNLVPYGGGAILNEVDGNLTLVKKPESRITVLHWQGKFRGLEFQPRSFRFEPVCSPDVVDNRGREVQLPVLRPCSAEDAEKPRAAEVERDIIILRSLSNMTRAATRRAITDATNIPKSAVDRQLQKLQALKLIETDLRGSVLITAKGRKQLEISGG